MFNGILLCMYYICTIGRKSGFYKLVNVLVKQLKTTYFNLKHIK